MHTVIETHGLTRRYGKQLAVDDLDLQVREGEIYGFLGLNGAGKTTTIRMIMGLIRPTHGTIRLLDRQMPADRMKVMGRVGALVESPSYYAHLDGRDNLRVIATLLDVPETRIAEVLRIVGLQDAARKKVGQYSLGMKQRLGIAAALLGEPKLLVLDEPTNGLDPAGIQEIRNLIVRMPKEFGITVMVSSHLLSEIDQMATHVGVIHRGRMLFQGPIDELRLRSAATVRLRVDDTQVAYRTLLRGGIEATVEEDGIALPTLEPEVAAAAVRALVAERVSVYRVQEHKPTLEDIFLMLTGEVQVA